MDADAKKTALRMIPYDIYVLTVEDKSAAACRGGRENRLGRLCDT